MHIVGGAPNVTVGVVNEDGTMSSNYGNPVDSVLRIKADSKTIENYAPGGLTSVVDVTLGGLDLNTGSTGGSSYAAVIVGSLAVDLKAKFPWLSSDEFKTGLVDGLYQNRPEPPFAASDAEIELFNKKWEKVNGGIFDAKLLADYIKETFKPKAHKALIGWGPFTMTLEDGDGIPHTYDSHINTACPTNDNTVATKEVALAYAKCAATTLKTFFKSIPQYCETIGSFDNHCFYNGNSHDGNPVLSADEREYNFWLGYSDSQGVETGYYAVTIATKWVCPEHTHIAAYRNYAPYEPYCAAD
jgi:hypothetical protein